MPSAVELLSDPQHGLVREVRKPQIMMAASVQEALDNGGVYVAEGPVGSGKTYAYLTPILLAAGRRFVVATAKKSLQDQVFVKDLPAIASKVDPQELRRLMVDAEKRERYMARVIKGKSNYACRLLAEKHTPDPYYLSWLALSPYGDRADFPGFVPRWWGSANAEGCIGRGCAHHRICGYMKLKQELLVSRGAIVNHHLLGSDMFYGLGKMVGGAYDVLVIDEAHKLADGIRSAFTQRVSEGAVEEIAKALENSAFIFTAPKKLMPAWSRLFQALPNKHWREAHERTPPVFDEELADECDEGLANVDRELAHTLGQYGIKGDPSDAGYWESFAQQTENLPDDVRAMLASIGVCRRKVDGLRQGMATAQGVPFKAMEEESDEAYQERLVQRMANTVVAASSDRGGRTTISTAPVNLGGIAKSYLGSIRTVIVTSATLAINGTFDHMDDVIGVKPTKTEVLPTTFNYAQQGFLYIPRDLPVLPRTDPGAEAAMAKKIGRIEQLVRWSDGRAFILTTANDELDAITTALTARLPNKVFAQGHAKNPWHGDAPAVLDMYLRTPRSVLVGSKSFWEGVDVVGAKLRLVILAKLPFPMFGDPIIKARERLAGESAFQRVQVGDMLIDLRQGAGRLIRSAADRGVVAVLDSRAWTKPYGRQVRTALGFPVTDDLKMVAAYLPKVVAYFNKRDPE